MAGPTDDALAILDGTILPAAEATIGVTDLGLIRGDGVFEVIALNDGRPFALEDHLRRMATSAQNLRLEIDLGAVARRHRRAARGGRADRRPASVRFMVTRGGRRIGLVEPSCAGRRRRRCGSRRVEYVPTRILDGIKSLSYGANMLATRIAVERGGDRGAARHAARPRAGGADVGVLRVLRRRDAGDAAAERPHPGLDHAPAVVVAVGRPRARGGRDGRRRSARAREAFLASTTREVQAVVAIDDIDAAGARPGR